MTMSQNICNKSRGCHTMRKIFSFNKTRRLQIVLIVLIIGMVLLISTPGLFGMDMSKTPAYQACRQVMDAEGYNDWWLTKARSVPLQTQFEFYDGCNTAWCTSIGIGPFWIPTEIGQTIISCEL
jgi:hypothetical protein